MRIDLHTHSRVSDGTDTPAGVIRAAVAAELDVVALTDHDTTAGWAEAREAADAAGIELVPGVEISARDRGVSVHLLGLWLDESNAAIQEIFARTRTARIDRAQEMVDRLSRDYPITWESVTEHSEDAETVGRPHIADALVAAGVVENRDAAFSELLIPESPYYVPHYAPEILEAIAAVRAAGGVPVFAHPGADTRGRVVPTSAIERMADGGLLGIEVDHRDHSPRQRERLARIARQFALIPTGSSDYHGTGKQNRIGENLTNVEAFERLKAAR